MNFVRTGAREARLIAPCVGCGFTLAFGWLWFPGLRESLLPGLAGNGGVFSLAAFGAALAAGFLIGGSLAGRMTAGTALLLSHIGAVSLLGLVILCGMAGSSVVPAGCPEVLLGLGAALPGVWWTSRLLVLGPAGAAAALAWAGLTALPLTFALSLFPDPLSPLLAACAVAAGIALALPPALPVLPQSRGSGTETGSAVPLPFSLSAAVAGLRGPTALAALFFGLGSLNVLALHGAGIPSGLTRACGAAQACGAALAAALFAARSRNRSGGGLLADFSSGGNRRAMVLAAGALAVPALCLPFFSGAASALFHACSGLAEAAALALAAPVCLESHGAGHAGEKNPPPGLYPSLYLTSGLFLLLALALVNGGGLAGRELLAWAGAVGPALPGLVAAGLLAALVWRDNQQTASCHGAESDPHTGPVAHAEPVPRDAPIPPDIASQLTGTEMALALLLLQGHSNKAIAGSLKLAENTIRWHIKKLNKKLGAHNRATLVAFLCGGVKKDEA